MPMLHRAVLQAMAFRGSPETVGKVAWETELRNCAHAHTTRPGACILLFSGVLKTFSASGILRVESLGRGSLAGPVLVSLRVAGPSDNNGKEALARKQRQAGGHGPPCTQLGGGEWGGALGGQPKPIETWARCPKEIRTAFCANFHGHGFMQNAWCRGTFFFNQKCHSPSNAQPLGLSFSGRAKPKAEK